LIRKDTGPRDVYVLVIMYMLYSKYTIQIRLIKKHIHVYGLTCLKI